MSYFINFFMIFILIINIKLSSLNFINETEKTKICYKSDITKITKNTYQNFKPSNPEKGNEENLISMILLNEEGNLKYYKKHIVKYDIINIILYLLIIISIFIFIDFNIHFFCKMQKKKERIKKNKTIEQNKNNGIENIEKEKPSKLDIFFDFFKISPFCWINYFLMKEAESKLYFTKYKNRKIAKINIKVKYIFSIISILLFLLAAGFAFINFSNNSDIEKGIYNLSCGLAVLLNKLMDEGDNFIGLNKANEFFVGLNEKNALIKSFKKEFNNTYYELQNKFSEWNSFLKEINITISDLKSKEFFIYNYPSTPYYIESTNLNECEKVLYQLEQINAYYPVERKGKYLYSINNTFFTNFEEIIKNIDDFNKNFIQPNNSKLLISENGLYHQIVEKSYQIVELYTKEFLTIYIPEIYDSISNRYLPFIYYIDISILFLIFINLACFFVFNFYLFSISFMKNKLFIAIIFYLLLFLLNFLSVFEFTIIQNVKKKITYVEDIYKGIYFLFDKNNLDYFSDKPDIYIKNISLSININNVTKNILYYLNQIINNNGNINNLYPVNTSISKKSEIDDFYKKFNSIFIPSTHNFTKNYTNTVLTKIKQYMDSLVNDGLLDYTPFINLNQTDSRQKLYETPMAYLSLINSRTDRSIRNRNSLKDFDCNEYWDIYGTGYDLGYVYLSRSEVICDTCINHYVDFNKTRVLNYEEFYFDEIMKRYEDLPEKDLTPFYNLLFYEFSGLEIFRSDKVKNQFLKIQKINQKIENSENELKNLLKNCSVFAYEIMTNYKNLFDNYTGTNANQDLYSFLNCDFLRNDINYLLAETENSLISEFKKIYYNHLYIFIAVIILEFDLIIYYCLSSYDLNKNKQIKEDSIIERVRKEINWSIEIQLDQDAMSVNGNKKKIFNESKTHNTFVFKGFKDKKSTNNALNFKRSSNETNEFFKHVFGYKQTQKKKQPILKIIIQGNNGDDLAINQLGDSDQSKASIICKEKESPTNKICINKVRKIAD